MPKSAYMKRIVQAHRLHHAVSSKHGTVSFGFLWAPPVRVLKAELERAGEPYQRERLTRKARLRKTLGDASAYPFSIWIWRMGSCLFVGYPGEAFSTLQTGLRAEFPDLTIVVMNVTNGSIGYLPPAPLYDVDMYEVWQTPLDRGCLEAVYGACVTTIRELIGSG